MISVFRPVQYTSCKDLISNYDGSTSPTPYLPFNYTVEGLTRDVYVKPLHSHNDYWRAHPLFDALSNGVQSIESDIWHFPTGFSNERTVTDTTSNGLVNTTVTKYFRNNEVYVGHSDIYLEPINTLNNLYLNPLYQFLEFTNPKFSNDNEDTTRSKNGVFYNSPETPVYLWFDFKTSPNDTYLALKPLLQPFIDANYLTYYDVQQDKVIEGPLILTITGNLPVELVQEEQDKRYFFLDGPLQLFKASTGSNDAELTKWSKLSRVVSCDASSLLNGDMQAIIKASRSPFTSDQETLIQSFFDTAHSYGLKTRIWGDVTWPPSIRDSHLKSYYEAGTDFLNVDDLKSASNLF
ncbi:hypothetical protein DFJ63DRAFT_183734 [Scheffersomyces coipomensis]|uniref:uncharacterized protein n=1 Tax=Scheffersomyces coipomensis TaxID=1788519 RepID=UPI00315D78C2